MAGQYCYVPLGQHLVVHVIVSFITVAALHRADSESTMRVCVGIRPAAPCGCHGDRQGQTDARST